MSEIVNLFDPEGVIVWPGAVHVKQYPWENVGSMTVAEAAANELDFTIDWVTSGGVCDGNNIAALGVPVLDTLGVRGANIHNPQEYIVLESLTERAQLTALILIKLANGGLPA